jgi:acyl carrier protein
MPSYENMVQKIFKILRAFVPDGQAITEDTNLVADLGLDSLKVMKILETVEDDLDISIPLNILPDVHTVKDFVTQIQKLNGEGQ